VPLEWCKWLLEIDVFSARDRQAEVAVVTRIPVVLVGDLVAPAVLQVCCSVVPVHREQSYRVRDYGSGRVAGHIALNLVVSPAQPDASLALVL